MQIDNNALLQEILIAPASQVITDRFSQENNQAGCNGTCKSGSCKGQLDHA
jgi:hypothetical protein